VTRIKSKKILLPFLFGALLSTLKTDTFDVGVGGSERVRDEKIHTARGDLLSKRSFLSSFCFEMY
jgi:hypothetical protein